MEEYTHFAEGRFTVTKASQVWVRVAPDPPGGSVIALTVTRVWKKKKSRVGKLEFTTRRSRNVYLTLYNFIREKKVDPGALPILADMIEEVEDWAESARGRVAALCTELRLAGGVKPVKV